MATIKDVAERAGLSTTLVSRYLNGRKGVSPDSREKIQSAIKELNYRPNGIARSLVLQKTQSIGIVLDNLCAPFAARLISGLEQGAEDFDKENKYNVLFCSSNGDLQKKKRHISYLTQGRVDGIIIYGSLTSDDTIIRELADSTFPFLLIENTVDDVNVDKVTIDNLEGAYRATEHLIKLGHKRIAHMAGNMNLKITLERMNGYIRALQDYQIPVQSDLILYPTFTPGEHHPSQDSDLRGDRSYYDAGYLEMKKMIAGGSLPDAIFFASDISAFGAIQAMEEAGIRVPEDISIIGFDDENPADYGCSCKPISTMRQPLYDLGYIGIKRLLASINDPDLPKEKVVLNAKLIVRDSCRNKEGIENETNLNS
ncbi:LacI family DNA-binding transcriptional regulator [Paenibacillus physcomitrellae]|uniref:LacI family transcriptional regulator n=1 Tax=Paenibacillus physcomitrellae TaxID=1619311 RepID=A0ABQ1G5Q6_9BACL|nr:LacI family DNA-binding transcriptional regulator [Paenibacillus physcomitrellae]GGA37097.1 LacI family transcriptional regulator [Paenibacillus physcomitrellae]